MLKIVIAEAELEPAPVGIKGHPSFKRGDRKKGIILLDSNFHHSAMKGLKDAYRRGRPDIVHVCLLNALDSPLNKEGGLEVYVHTRNDQVIEMSPSWRVPRSYNRFVGLIEDLFEKREIVHDGLTLLRIRDMGLIELIESISDGMDIKLMHYRGDEYRPTDDAVIIIGGFPHGDFTGQLDYPRYTIYKKELMAWSVLNHVIYSLK